MKFRFGVTCPTCGDELETVTLGTPTESGTRVANIVACPRCEVEWMLALSLTYSRRDPFPTPPKRRRQISATTFIHEVLSQPMTAVELHEKCDGEWSRNHLQQTLANMCDAGVVTRERRGQSWRYQLV